MECCKISARNYPAGVPSDKNWFFTECIKNNETIDSVYEMFNRKHTVEDKFLYVRGLLKKYHKLPLTLTNVDNNKSNEIARGMRYAGDKELMKKSYENAFFSYNSSIMMAEIGSTEYALAVANRSAVLYHKEEYDACIRDINHAMSNGYPSEQAFNLHERELKCLEKLGRLPEARLKLEVRIIMFLLQNKIYTIYYILVDFHYLTLFQKKKKCFSEIIVLHFTIFFG